MSTTEPEKQIGTFFHCAKCLAEKPDDISPRDWSMLEVGWTRKGIQIWCKRHDINVMHLDFMGQKVKIANDGE